MLSILCLIGSYSAQLTSNSNVGLYCVMLEGIWRMLSLNSSGRRHVQLLFLLSSKRMPSALMLPHVFRPNPCLNNMRATKQLSLLSPDIPCLCVTHLMLEFSFRATFMQFGQHPSFKMHPVRQGLKEQKPVPKASASWSLLRQVARRNSCLSDCETWRHLEVRLRWPTSVLLALRLLWRRPHVELQWGSSWR